jgi:hypothetical protein
MVCLRAICLRHCGWAAHQQQPCGKRRALQYPLGLIDPYHHRLLWRSAHQMTGMMNFDLKVVW